MGTGLFSSENAALRLWKSQVAFKNFEKYPLFKETFEIRY